MYKGREKFSSKMFFNDLLLGVEKLRTKHLNKTSLKFKHRKLTKISLNQTNDLIAGIIDLNSKAYGKGNKAAVNLNFKIQPFNEFLSYAFLSPKKKLLKKTNNDFNSAKRIEPQDSIDSWFDRRIKKQL